MGRHLGHERAEHEIGERHEHIEIAIHPHVVNPVVPLDKLEDPRALDQSDRRLVHEIVHALVAHIVDRNTRGDCDHEREIRKRDARSVECPCDERPGRCVDGDEHGPSPPCERERLVLLFIGNMERVVEFTELVMDERVLGETVLGEPWPVQPEAVERPLHKAGLDQGD